MQCIKMFTAAWLLTLVAGNVASAEDFIDAEGDVANAAELDRFESFNRAMFSFNDTADAYVLKPVAKAYRFVTPGFVDEGISNFFNNLDDVETFANSLLQGKFHNATVTLNRIIYNTIFGLAGFIDVATSFGLHNDEEDFGQTLAAWGYENSSYLVLPLLGPATIRDAAGMAVDTVFEPLQYIDDVSDEQRRIATVVKLIDKRADLLSAENLLLGDDRYAFMRNAFLQNREFLINDGEVEDSFADEDFEDLEGF